MKIAGAGIETDGVGTYDAGMAWRWWQDLSCRVGWIFVPVSLSNIDYVYVVLLNLIIEEQMIYDAAVNLSHICPMLPPDIDM